VIYLVRGQRSGSPRPTELWQKIERRFGKRSTESHDHFVGPIWRTDQSCIVSHIFWKKSGDYVRGLYREYREKLWISKCSKFWQSMTLYLKQHDLKSSRLFCAVVGVRGTTLLPSTNFEKPEELFEKVIY
jgi:hypothetical protein